MSYTQNDKAAVENEDVMGKNVEDFFNNEPETASQTTHVSKHSCRKMNVSLMPSCMCTVKAFPVL